MKNFNYVVVICTGDKKALLKYGRKQITSN